MAGRFNRAAAISWPGTILSQEEMNTRPSKELQRTIISMLSAIRSRWGRMYFIGSKPQLVASQGAGVLNSKGTPPAMSTPCFTASATLSRCAWPGLISV